MKSTVLPGLVSQTSATALEFINQRGLRISVIQQKAPTSNIMPPSYFASLIFAENLKSAKKEKFSMIGIAKVHTVPVRAVTWEMFL